MAEFRTIERKQEFSPLEPVVPDPRLSPFIPDLSVDTQQVRELSVVRLEGIGIRVYDGGGNNTSISDSTDTTVNFDTVDFAQGFDSPSGATFTTITIPRDGVYVVTGQIEYAYTGTNYEASLWLYVDSAKHEGNSAKTNTMRNRRSVTAVRVFTAGTTVGLRVRNEEGLAAALDLASGSTNCSLSAVYLMGI